MAIFNSFLFVYQRVTYSKNIKRSHEEEILPVELWHVCQSLADLHHRCQTWIFMGIRFAYHLVIFPGHGKHMKIPMTSTYVLVLMFPTYHVYIILYIIIHIHISICMCCVCTSALCVFILPGGKELSIAQRSTWHRVPALCPLFAGYFHPSNRYDIIMHDISARS